MWWRLSNRVTSIISPNATLLLSSFYPNDGVPSLWTNVYSSANTSSSPFQGKKVFSLPIPKGTFPYCTISGLSICQVSIFCIKASSARASKGTKDLIYQGGDTSFM